MISHARIRLRQFGSLGQEIGGRDQIVTPPKLFGSLVAGIPRNTNHPRIPLSRNGNNYTNSRSWFNFKVRSFST